MRKLSIITLDDYSDPLISSIHEKGIVQIHDVTEKIKDLEWREILKPSKVGPQITEITSFLMRITTITDFWKSVKSKKVSPLDLIAGFVAPEIPEKKEVEELTRDQILENAKDILEKVESRTKTIQQRLDDVESQKIQLETDLKSAKNLEFLDLDISDLKDTAHTTIITGKLNLEIFPKFNDELTTLTDEVVIFENDIDEESKKILVIITSQKNRENVNKLLRKFEFERFDVSKISGKPQEAIENVEIKIKELDKEKKELIIEVNEISAKWEEDILIIKEQLEIERERNEIFTSFAKTDKTYMIEAWVKEKDLHQTLDLIKESTDNHVIIDVKNPDGEKNIPVHLENPRFAKPFEFMTKMYSPPQYNELDPTIFFAIVFPFFFGFCLTDGLYGVFDILAGAIIFLGLGKINKTLSSFGLIMIAAGSWTLVLALMTNGFMGDIFPTYLGAQIPVVVHSVDAFVFPQNILIMALLAGLSYTTLGLIVGAYNNISKGAISDAIGDQICWLVLILGVILLGVAYLSHSFSIYIGVGVAVIGLALLVYHNGLFGLMDVMGLVGTVFSYSRLLALCLSTGGMAIAVNIVAFKVVGMVPVVGVALTALVLVAGHPANAMIQSLGAFIHSMRLHYVEFFSQFYNGGGLKFRPFKAKRKITTLEA
ncbi:MAG: V-type ATP synthase subunit I [Neobacillus sp.]